MFLDSFLLILVATPKLDELFREKMTKDKKVRLLSWIVGLELSLSDVNSIPGEFFIDVMVCLYLVNAKAINMVEAETLMRSVVESHDDSLMELSQYPDQVSIRAFRITFLYTKLFLWLYSCFSAAGLKTFTVRKLLCSSLTNN